MPDTTPSRPAMTMREIRERLGHVRPETTPETTPAAANGLASTEAALYEALTTGVRHAQVRQHLIDQYRAAVAATAALLVLGTTDQQPETSPCGPVPDVCDAEEGDPCANHEREQAHSEGEHAFCGNECAVATDQQPETAPTDPTVCPRCNGVSNYAFALCVQCAHAAPADRRDRIAQALAADDGHPWDTLSTDAQQHYGGNADAVLAVLPAPTDQATEFELRADTEIRAAALREAADEAQRIATAMATADEDWASRAGWACASVATGLRRLADEAQQPETEAHEHTWTSVPGSGAYAQLIGHTWTRCTTCGQTQQQPETEAHPAEHTWAAELHDPLADEWVPGTRYLVRERAVNHLEHSRKIAPTWKDGTPTQRRLVRATTTYTVVADEQPETEAAK